MALDEANLSDFQLNEPIGAGATARVFDAVHRKTGRQVAIKLLAAEASPELRERLAREAHILAGVDSRHVGRIFGWGYDKERPFLVLERLRGETLDALIKREGQLKTRDVMHWVEHLLVGVRDCHDKGIVHRDVKPANVFLVDDGGEKIAKLIDFGVARLREMASVAGGLTQTQHVLGSIGYMAPEQFTYARGAGPQADLYAVGVVVFRIIAGRLPFVSRSLEVVIKSKGETDAPLLSSMPNVVSIRALDDFCAKALTRDLNKRYQNASEMLDAWWNVVSYIDEDAPLTVDSAGLDVIFDDADPEALVSTLMDPGTFPSATEREPFSAKNLSAPGPLSITRPGASSKGPVEPGERTDPSAPSMRKLVEAELELRRRRGH